MRKSKNNHVYHYGNADRSSQVRDYPKTFRDIDSTQCEHRRSYNPFACIVLKTQVDGLKDWHPNHSIVPDENK